MSKGSISSQEQIIRHGWGIINPFGGLWTHEIFNTPEDALKHLKRHFPDKKDFRNFNAAKVELVIKVARPPGEAEVVSFIGAE